MLDSAATGAIIGAAARAGPELLKFLDRHLDRRHELAMQDKALKHDELAAAQGRTGKISEKELISANQLQDVLGLMRDAYSQQFNTGNPWLNAISVLVRPCVTWALLFTYIGVKAVMVFVAARQEAAVDALLRAYGADDVAILSGVLFFWFLDRAAFKAPK